MLTFITVDPSASATQDIMVMVTTALKTSHAAIHQAFAIETLCAFKVEHLSDALAIQVGSTLPLYPSNFI